MTRKMEDVARELQEEAEELLTFVKQKFLEIVEELGKPKPVIPDSDTKVVFFLRSKAFVKTLLDSERRDGKIESGHEELKLREIPHSRVCGITLPIKHPTDKTKKFVNILLNCACIRSDVPKAKIDLEAVLKTKIGLKEYTTLVLIHEMIHNMEILTGISLLKSPSLLGDGFTIPIYEEWASER